MTTGPRQLALALDHTESFAREDFLSGPSNAAALALIECWPGWPNGAIILTGPEGGWTDRERALAVRGGWKPVSLSSNILRSETAAIAALSILSHAWHNQS